MDFKKLENFIKEVKSTLNYHRKKPSNVNFQNNLNTSKPIDLNNYLITNNSYCGLITSQNFLTGSKGDCDTSNLLKLFSSWKTVDDDITNKNIEDLKKTIFILEKYIKYFKVRIKKIFYSFNKFI